MTLVPLPNNHFAVSVPEGTLVCEINYDGNKVVAWQDGCFVEIEIPSGDYTIVGLASEITEEQAGEIVDGAIMEDEFYEKSYKDYTVPGRWATTALESFRSLLLSLSLDKNALIIKQNK